MNTETGTLTITVHFSNGVEMEDNLNKAVDDLASAIIKKGLMNMTLEGKQAESLAAMYKVEIQNNPSQQTENQS